MRLLQIQIPQTFVATFTGEGGTYLLLLCLAAAAGLLPLGGEQRVGLLAGDAVPVPRRARHQRRAEGLEVGGEVLEVSLAAERRLAHGAQLGQQLGLGGQPGRGGRRLQVGLVSRLPGAGIQNGSFKGGNGGDETTQ